MVGVFVLGALAHHLLERGSFLKEYFLGDRKLNAWVLSLTYVATSVSAGSFVGFPSFIYLHGWIMALWIAGYMISGLTTKGCWPSGLTRSPGCRAPSPCRRAARPLPKPRPRSAGGILLVVFLMFNLVAQFKAGGVILQQACGGIHDNGVYHAVRDGTAAALATAAFGTTRPPPGKKPRKQRCLLACWPARRRQVSRDVPWAALHQYAQQRPTSFYGPEYPDYVLAS